MFRVEGLLEHCVEAFGRGLKVDTAVEQLVWAHNHGLAEARTVATEYFVRKVPKMRGNWTLGWTHRRHLSLMCLSCHWPAHSGRCHV